jgi:hypothetical protein
MVPSLDSIHDII